MLVEFEEGEASFLWVGTHHSMKVFLRIIKTLLESGLGQNKFDKIDYEDTI